MNITITLDKTSVEKHLRLIAASAKDMQETLAEVGDELLSFYGDQVFMTQGAAINDPWRALAVSTLRARARRTGYYKQTPIMEGKILVWTGRLKRGMKKQATANQLRIYNDVDYFKYHQRAGGRPPQRKMLAITSDVVTRVVSGLQKGLAKRANL